MGELEKCLEDNEHLPELFIKHVSGTLMMRMTVVIIMISVVMVGMMMRSR